MEIWVCKKCAFTYEAPVAQTAMWCPKDRFKMQKVWQKADGGPPPSITEEGRCPTATNN
jgi:hypothetical protein